jgi:hypothetical protein
MGASTNRENVISDLNAAGVFVPSDIRHILRSDFGQTHIPSCRSLGLLAPQKYRSFREGDVCQAILASSKPPRYPQTIPLGIGR